MRHPLEGHALWLGDPGRSAAISGGAAASDKLKIYERT